MALTAIEIMALIVVVAGLIKILVLSIKPKAWKGVADAVYAQPAVTTTISLVLAAAALYYLLGAGITIVQIFAVMLFTMLLLMLSFSAYPEATAALTGKLFKDRNVLKKGWLVMVVWIILMVWVLYVLFA